MTDRAPLCYLDTETVGLNADTQAVWEVAVILEPGLDGVEVTERVWQLPVDLSTADRVALNIGRFWERRGREVSSVSEADLSIEGTAEGGLVVSEYGMARWAQTFARLTWGRHLVGAVVSFDEERLRRLLRANGACEGWNYHLVDVEGLAAGWLSGALDLDDERRALARPPWSSNDLSLAVGVNPEDFDRHTALGDCRWARSIYRSVMGLGDA